MREIRRTRMVMTMYLLLRFTKIVPFLQDIKIIKIVPQKESSFMDDSTNDTIPSILITQFHYHAITITTKLNTCVIMNKRERKIFFF